MNLSLTEVLNNTMFEIDVDIEKIERFKNKTLENDAHFLKTIFTDTELEYSFSDGHHAQHLCARFCAKEATIKSMKTIYIKFAVKRENKFTC